MPEHYQFQVIEPASAAEVADMADRARSAEAPFKGILRLVLGAPDGQDIPRVEPTEYIFRAYNIISADREDSPVVTIFASMPSNPTVQEVIIELSEEDRTRPATVDIIARSSVEEDQ